MNGKTLQKKARSHALGLTLMELLVTLILTGIVFGMLMPMLGSLMRPPQRLEITPQPAWQKILAADCQQLVSPAKCAFPVVRFLPPDNDDPMPQLILQTLCRIGDDSQSTTPRGPTEVRYRLEVVQGDGPYALVRYAQGWHDMFSSRMVIAQGVTDWNLTRLPDLPADAPSNTNKQTKLPQALQVELRFAGASQKTAVWIPQVDAPAGRNTSTNGAQ